MKDQELEVKYYVENLRQIEDKIVHLGGICIQPRIHELNLRFDTPDGSLTRQSKALRLRYDTQARLTFKGPGEDLGGARLRQEIEFIASDYQSALSFLTALGFQVSIIYEKYRTSYDLENVHILLDELPFGNFVEIEGSDPSKIREMSDRLGLNWENRVPASYTVLFDWVKEKRGFTFRDLVFENFKDIHITSKDLGIQSANANQGTLNVK